MDMHKYIWLLLVTCEIIRVNHLDVSGVITSWRQFFFLASHQRQTLDVKRDFFFENSHSRQRRRALCRVHSRSHAVHMFSKMLTAGKAAPKAEKHAEKRGFSSLAVGHGNVISSSAPRKTPTEKSPGRLFVFCLEEKRGRLWEGVCAWEGHWREAVVA